MVIRRSIKITLCKRSHYSYAVLSVLVLSVADVYALDWRIRPSLSMSEVFSDNLNLSENAKQSGFVSEVAPGISMYAQSPWSNFNLNYRLQGLYNAGGNEAFETNHQLQMNSLYQAVRNTLFLETSSSISQQNLSNAYKPSDNISGSGDRTEVQTFNISPYWTPHFGRLANGLFRLGYNKATFDNPQNALEGTAFQNDVISDSQSYTKQASLNSGSYFSLVNWGLSYSSNDNSRASGNDANFESYNGNVRYFIDRKFNVFAQGGYENNDFQSTTDSSKNGFFYTVGGQWRPSQFYSLEAGVGNNKHVTLQFNPSPRLNSNITYRNKDIGLNRGNSWDALLNYRVGQSATLGFIYAQETTTVQQQLVNQGLIVDPTTGQARIDPLTGRPLVIDPVLFSQLGLSQRFLFQGFANLVDDVIVSKRANLNFAYQTGKSNFNVSAFNDRRTYQLSNQEDNIYGISGGWQWQVAPRLNFFFQPLWQSTQGVADNNRYDISLGLTRPFPINLGRPLTANTRLEFRHIEQMSDNSDYDFTENRATANFAVQF